MNPGEPTSTRLSDDELAQLVSLLHRFCDADLDQWALWRLGSNYDRVFIAIGRRPFPDTPDEMYTDIGRWVEEHRR